MSNAILYLRNFAADGTIISATSEAGTLVAENMLDGQPSVVWRGTSAADQVIIGDLGSSKIVSGFGMIAHNFTEATVTLEIATDTAFTASSTTYSGTWAALDPLYTWGTGDVGDTNSTFGGYALDQFGDTYLIKNFDAVYGRYWRLTISGLTTTAPEIGSLFIGEAFQPVINVAQNVSIAVRDPSSLIVTRSGAMRSTNNSTYREHSLQWDMLSTEEAFILRRSYAEVGVKNPVIIDLMPDLTGPQEIETKMMGRITSFSGPTLRSDLPNTYSVSMTIREAL